MVSRDVQVMNANGIHARPSAEIVKVAGRYASHVTMAKDGLEVNAKSIMGVMMLAAECGAMVRVSCDGPDEADALDALATLIASKFGES